MHKKNFWLGYIIGILLAVGAMWFYNHLVEIDLTPEVNLETLQLTDLTERKININDYKNKPLVLNFWATWCKPCIHEFPDYEKAKQQFSEKIIFIMISDEPIEKIKKFKETNSYTFIFLRSQKSLDQYGIFSRPSSYFFDSKGELISKEAGSMREEEIIKYIKEIF